MKKSHILLILIIVAILCMAVFIYNYSDVKSQCNDCNNNSSYRYSDIDDDNSQIIEADIVDNEEEQEQDDDKSSCSSCGINRALKSDGTMKYGIKKDLAVLNGLSKDDASTLIKGWHGEDVKIMMFSNHVSGYYNDVFYYNTVRLLAENNIVIDSKYN